MSIMSMAFPPQISSAMVLWTKCPVVVGLHLVCSRSIFYSVVPSVDNLVCIFHSLNQSVASEEEQ